MNDLRFLSLTNGGFTVVDADVFEGVNQHRWQRKPSGHIYRCDRSKKTITLHRVINETPEGFTTDHRNRLPFDNRKSNLRTALSSQNSANRNLSKAKYPSDFRSLYKGVVRGPKCKSRKWAARITVNRKSIYLGLFETELDAAKAYNKAAQFHFGEFSLPNNLNSEAQLG